MEVMVMDKMRRVHIRVPSEVLEGLRELANHDGRSLNNYLVEVVFKPCVGQMSQLKLAMGRENIKGYSE